MTSQIDRLYGSQGLYGYSVHPGSFVSENLQKHCRAEMEALTGDERILKYMTNLEQACVTTVYGAVSSDLEGKGGLYLEGAPVSARPCPQDGAAVEYGSAEYAFDRAKEEALWELSKKMGKVE